MRIDSKLRVMLSELILLNSDLSAIYCTYNVNQ